MKVFSALAGGTLSALVTVPIDVMVATIQDAGKSGKQVSVLQTLRQQFASGGFMDTARSRRALARLCSAAKQCMLWPLHALGWCTTTQAHEGGEGAAATALWHDKLKLPVAMMLSQQGELMLKIGMVMCFASVMFMAWFMDHFYGGGKATQSWAEAMGVAMLQDGWDVLQFIKQADERLYAAKRRSDSKLRVLEEQYRLLKVSTAAP